MHRFPGHFDEHYFPKALLFTLALLAVAAVFASNPENALPFSSPTLETIPPVAYLNAIYFQGAPALQIVSPSNGDTISPETALTVSASGSIQYPLTVQVLLNGSPMGEFGVPQTPFSIQVPWFNGLNDARVTGRDSFGQQLQPAMVSVTVGEPLREAGNPPTVSIQSPTNGSTVSQPSLEVRGSILSENPLIELRVSVNSVSQGSYPVQGNSFLFPVQLNPGANTIRVAAIDSLGLEGASTVNVTFSEPVPFDTIPPVVSIAEPANNSSTTNGSVVVSGNISDNMAASFSVRVTNNAVQVGNTFTSSTGAFSVLVPLTLGSNTLTVYATDTAGNAGMGSRTVNRNPTTTQPPTTDGGPTCPPPNVICPDGSCQPECPQPPSPGPEPQPEPQPQPRGCVPPEVACANPPPACAVPVCYRDADCDDANPNTLDQCINPGTCRASCSHSPQPQPPGPEPVVPPTCLPGEILCSDDFGSYCFQPCHGNGDCNPNERCVNPSTCSAQCVPEQSEACLPPQIQCPDGCRLPACTTNAQCDDANPQTVDRCMNAGTCNAKCMHTAQQETPPGQQGPGPQQATTTLPPPPPGTAPGASVYFVWPLPGSTTTQAYAPANFVLTKRASYTFSHNGTVVSTGSGTGSITVPVVLVAGNNRLTVNATFSDNSKGSAATSITYTATQASLASPPDYSLQFVSLRSDKEETLRFRGTAATNLSNAVQPVQTVPLAGGWLAVTPGFTVCPSSLPNNTLTAVSTLQLTGNPLNIASYCNFNGTCEPGETACGCPDCAGQPWPTTCPNPQGYWVQHFLIPPSRALNACSSTVSLPGLGPMPLPATQNCFPALSQRSLTLAAFNLLTEIAKLLNSAWPPQFVNSKFVAPAYDPETAPQLAFQFAAPILAGIRPAIPSAATLFLVSPQPAPLPPKYVYLNRNSYPGYAAEFDVSQLPLNEGDTLYLAVQLMQGAGSVPRGNPPNVLYDCNDNADNDRDGFVDNATECDNAFEPSIINLFTAPGQFLGPSGAALPGLRLPAGTGAPAGINPVGTQGGFAGPSGAVPPSSRPTTPTPGTVTGVTPPGAVPPGSRGGAPAPGTTIGITPTSAVPPGGTGYTGSGPGFGGPSGGVPPGTRVPSGPSGIAGQAPQPAQPTTPAPSPPQPAGPTQSLAQLVYPFTNVQPSLLIPITIDCKPQDTRSIACLQPANRGMNTPNCVPGTSLCSDGSCQADCSAVNATVQGCLNENNVCEPGEGCACADCFGKELANNLFPNAVCDAGTKNRIAQQGAKNLILVYGFDNGVQRVIVAEHFREGDSSNAQFACHSPDAWGLTHENDEPVFYCRFKDTCQRWTPDAGASETACPQGLEKMRGNVFDASQLKNYSLSFDDRCLTRPTTGTCTQTLSGGSRTYTLFSGQAVAKPKSLGFEAGADAFVVSWFKGNAYFPAQVRAFRAAGNPVPSNPAPSNAPQPQIVAGFSCPLGDCIKEIALLAGELPPSGRLACAPRTSLCEDCASCSSSCAPPYCPPGTSLCADGSCNPICEPLPPPLPPTGCPVGTTLCSNGSCAADCSPTAIFAECNGNGVCDEGEGCTCADCTGFQDSCIGGALCKSFDEIVSGDQALHLDYGLCACPDGFSLQDNECVAAGCPAGTNRCVTGECSAECETIKVAGTLRITFENFGSGLGSETVAELNGWDALPEMQVTETPERKTLSFSSQDFLRGKTYNWAIATDDLQGNLYKLAFQFNPTNTDDVQGVVLSITPLNPVYLEPDLDFDFVKGGLGEDKSKPKLIRELSLHPDRIEASLADRVQSGEKLAFRFTPAIAKTAPGGGLRLAFLPQQTSTVQLASPVFSNPFGESVVTASSSGSAPLTGVVHPTALLEPPGGLFGEFTIELEFGEEQQAEVEQEEQPCNGNNVCEASENCSCSDCSGQTSVCSGGAVCSGLTETCACPAGTIQNAQGNCVNDVFCPVGTTRCYSGKCAPPQFCGPITSCNDNSVCEDFEACGCADCLNELSICQRGARCSADNVCACEEGFVHCPDGTCRPQDMGCEEPETLQIVLRETVTLGDVQRIRVANNLGQDIRGATVSVQLPDASLADYTTDDEGRVEFTVTLAGLHAVNASIDDLTATRTFNAFDLFGSFLSSISNSVNPVIEAVESAGPFGLLLVLILALAAAFIVYTDSTAFFASGPKPFSQRRKEAMLRAVFALIAFALPLTATAFLGSGSGTILALAEIVAMLVLYYAVHFWRERRRVIKV